MCIFISKYEHNKVSLEDDEEKAQKAAFSSAAAAELRALPKSEIAAKIEHLLIQISAQSPSPLFPPIDMQAPLMTLGLDSMTLIQIKGVIEKKFYCRIPDEFLFSQVLFYL